MEAHMSWHQQGYVVLRKLLHRSKIERALEEAIALYQRQDLISREDKRCRFRGELFETFDPIIDLSPAAELIARDPTLLNELSHLYGEPARLFKDKLIYKPPGCPGYGLHQDWIAWPGFPRSFLTVLAPLEPSTLDNGCTVVYPGYHHEGSLSLGDGEYHELPAELVDEARAVPLELEPGDVAIFGGFVPHRSAPNQSSRWRRQLYLSYNALSDGGEQREAHYREFHQWLERRSR
jgi:2-aminoethylphosphonate dioxygenase